MGDHLPYRDDLFLNYKSINIKWIAALKRSPSHLIYPNSQTAARMDNYADIHMIIYC
jgi:hypothetical protein